MLSGGVVIPAGRDQRCGDGHGRGDANYEADETILVHAVRTRSAPPSADGAGVLTIVNDEPLVAFADGYATAYVTPLTVAAPGVLANDNAHGPPTLTAVLISPRRTAR